MKKMFILIILGGLFFMLGCNNNLENVYKKEKDAFNKDILP